MKPLLEDTFESFIGVTEFLIDSHFDRHGLGNVIIYNFLKSVFDEGKSVSDLKREIGDAFKQTGRNMANLATSGYFEGFIKEYYEELSQEPDFSPDKFQKYFVEVVRTTPFTVFVSREKINEELMEEIKSKLERFQKYGAECLYVHALGKKNVIKVIDIIQKLEGKGDVEITIELLGKEMNIILMKIKLKGDDN